MLFGIDPDLYRSASHRNLAAHVAGPLQAGAVDSELVFVEGNRIELTGISREPLLLVAPARSLNATVMRVSAILDPDGAPTKLRSLEFAAYTEEGAFLVLHRPAADPVTRTAEGFVIEVDVSFFDEDGAAVVVDDPSPAANLQVRLFQGTLGALAYIMGAEKQRIRRQAREIAAMRSLSLARRDALDRLGADLAIPRFSDRIAFDAAKKEIVSVHKDAAGNPVHEPDIEYGRRLQLFRPWLIPTPGNILQLLNGPGQPGDPNAGPLGELGLQQRFELVQANNELSFSVFLSSTAPNLLNNLLNFVRTAYLIWPADSPIANGVHLARPMPSAARKRLGSLRQIIRDRFDFDPDAAIAPQIANCLGQAARCLSALGFAGKIKVKRAQDATGGSRYQLGIGVDIEPISAANLNSLHAALSNPNRPDSDDPQTESLLRTLTSLSAANDPEGAWLFQGCGLRTLHRVNSQTIYLSHLPTFGLVVSRTQAADARGAGPFEARYHAPGDPGANVVLNEAISRAIAEWVAGGGEALTRLTDVEALEAWKAPVVLAPAAQTIFRAAGLPAVANNVPVIAALKNLPGELIETIELGPAMSNQVINGDSAVISRLAKLTGLLRGAGVTSALPLMVSGNRIHLVAAVIGLPEAGINLADRRATGFRWYVVPIEGPGGHIKTVGSRTTYAPTGPGVNAIVCVGYARRGLADPYEFRVELPNGANLNLLQYEYLMNLLERICPLGVEVNTFSIRQRHVDLDGDGDAEPLPPVIFNTYRRFHRPRHRGESSVGLDPNS